ncbi:hypothetical protein K470DRAFT_243313, partial [Piedraia hortae CBS 480.64]
HSHYHAATGILTYTHLHLSCPCFRLSLRPLRVAVHSHPRELNTYITYNDGTAQARVDLGQKITAKASSLVNRWDENPIADDTLCFPFGCLL